MTDSPSGKMTALIQAKLATRTQTGVWMRGLYKDIQKLSPDEKGEIGEMWLEAMLTQCGYSVYRDRKTDQDKGWDLLVNDTWKLEVKLATIGRDGKTFQHEKIREFRDYDILALVDVTPDGLYLTLAPKANLPFDEKRKNKLYSVRRKKMHARKADPSEKKWDLSLKDVASRKISSLEDVCRMAKEAFAFE